MKINFKKIATVIGSALMVGSTVGMAAAMSFPAPFVSNSGANVAIVVGSSSQVALSDAVAAANLGSVLASKLAANTATAGTAAGATASGGDSYKIDKTSTKLWLGKNLTDVVSPTITADNLPTLLADGKYSDINNDEFDYSQKMTLGTQLQLGLFDDSNYKTDTPTIGIKIPSGTAVLNYTLTFTTDPTLSNLPSTNLDLLGKTYYVLSVGTTTNTNDTLTLLDAAQSTVLNEGDSKTLSVNGTSYNVSIGFIGTSQVKLNVNGQTTNALSTGQTQRLSDGSYVGVKSILTQDYAGGVKQVEFSIGSGKLKLANGQDIQMNDNTISRLTAYVTNSSTTKLHAISLEWKADGSQFVTTDSSPAMPGFGAVKLTFGGMSYPSSETINLAATSDTVMTLKQFPLKDDTTDINLLYSTDNANITGTGRSATEQLVTVGSGNLTFDSDTGSYFVASWNDTSNYESYLMRATNFKQTTGSVNKTTIQYRKAGSWTSVKEDAQPGDSVNVGSLSLTVGYIDYNGRNVVLAPGTGVSFNTLFSADGLKIALPYTNSSATATNFACSSSLFLANQIGPMNVSNATGSTGPICYPTSYVLNMNERDKSGNIAAGDAFNATVGFNSAATKQIYVSNVASDSGFFQDGSTKKYEGYMYSGLATKFLWDKSQDQYALGITYNGGESFGNVFLAAPSVSVSAAANATTGGSAQELGSVTVYDNEVSTVSAKNLVVVGGSCINAVAAKLLGSDTPVCGADFTAKTGIADGQFLIQSFASPYTANNVALLVAGYNAADTTKAATYLSNNAVTTDVGTKVKKTSVTFADVV